MTQDINLTNFINTLKEKKRVAQIIVVASLVLSIIYSLTAQKLYKSSIYVIPPQSKYVNMLNVFDDDGKLLINREIRVKDVYKVFVLNAQSRKHQRNFFFENELYKHFSEPNKEISFEENFHKKLNFVIDSGVMSREIRDEQFLTISFIHTDPKISAKWLNEYVDMSNKLTSKELADSINELIQNTKNQLVGQALSKRNLAKKTMEDRIIQLEEALKIANQLNITERSSASSNQQSVILSDGENLVAEDPLYLIGSKALMVEIDAIKNRKSAESFIPGLRRIEQRIQSLDSIIVDGNLIKSAEIDQKAIAPSNRFAPKRKLIVLLGTSFGVFLAFIYLLISAFISRKI